MRRKLLVNNRQEQGNSIRMGKSTDHQYLKLQKASLLDVFLVFSFFMNVGNFFHDGILLGSAKVPRYRVTEQHHLWKDTSHHMLNSGLKKYIRQYLLVLIYIKTLSVTSHLKSDFPEYYNVLYSWPVTCICFQYAVILYFTVKYGNTCDLTNQYVYSKYLQVVVAFCPLEVT